VVDRRGVLLPHCCAQQAGGIEIFDCLEGHPAGALAVYEPIKACSAIRRMSGEDDVAAVFPWMIGGSLPEGW
jgi:hypothetical protein